MIYCIDSNLLYRAPCPADSSTQTNWGFDTGSDLLYNNRQAGSFYKDLSGVSLNLVPIIIIVVGRIMAPVLISMGLVGPVGPVGWAISIKGDL